MGSYFITEDYTFDPIVEFGGNWVRVEGGRALWTTITDGEGGVKVSAGLPNIQGKISASLWSDTELTSSGAFDSIIIGTQTRPVAGEKHNLRGFTFNASKSNAIYGASTTVQPPAIKVYIWRRLPDEE